MIPSYGRINHRPPLDFPVGMAVVVVVDIVLAVADGLVVPAPQVAARKGSPLAVGAC